MHNNLAAINLSSTNVDDDQVVQLLQAIKADVQTMVETESVPTGEMLMQNVFAAFEHICQQFGANINQTGSQAYYEEEFITGQSDNDGNLIADKIRGTVYFRDKQIINYLRNEDGSAFVIEKWNEPAVKYGITELMNLIQHQIN